MGARPVVVVVVPPLIMLYCDRKEEEMTAAKEGGVQLSHLTLATTEILTDASDVEVARGGDGMGQRRDGGPLPLPLWIWRVCP